MRCFRRSGVHRDLPQLDRLHVRDRPHECLDGRLIFGSLPIVTAIVPAFGVERLHRRFWIAAASRSSASRSWPRVAAGVSGNLSETARLLGR
jgi:hypothetical protein